MKYILVFVLSKISVHVSTPRQYLDFELTSYMYCPSQPALKGDLYSARQPAFRGDTDLLLQKNSPLCINLFAPIT